MEINNLESAELAIKKQYGEGALIRMSEHPKMESISTGSILLDRAIGIGGIPKGRITEIYGTESSGKTCLSLHIIAEAQKQGGKAAFIDAEHSLSLTQAKNIGVKIEDLIVSQPDCGEEALDIVDTLVRSNELAVIVVDSVAALVPRAEIEGDMGESHIGLQARLMSQALRKLAGIISKTNCSVVFINQLRSKILAFGNPETTTGGNALKFYASVRLDVRRKDKIMHGTECVGNNVIIKVAKSKVSPPFKEINTYIVFSKGIDKPMEVLDYLISKGTIDKAGSWFKYKEVRLQGAEKMAQHIEEHMEEFLKEI